MKKLKLLSAVFAITGIGVMAMGFFGPSQKVAALSGSQFNPGRIIDDSVFYQAGSMNTSQIQSFLNQEVPTCDTNGTQIYSGSETRAQYGESKGYPPPYICLKNFTQNTEAETAQSGICSYLPAVNNDSAADIISRVSSACGINPKVLIVLLQKEQGLVTDDWPWPIEYQSATGYGCPDSSVCSTQYYGFFNQVYNAAWQFKEYQANPTNFSYVAGQNNSILYNPNTACGSETVYIQNQATAGLYNYTPYVPDAAALKYVSSTSSGGTGDGCSSYGNRNFWWYYNVWFGSTDSTPFFRINNGTAIYMLGANSNYYQLGSPSEMTAYGYKIEFNTIDSMPSTYISGLTNDGTLPLTAHFDGGSAIYLIDGGGAHYVPSQGVYNAYGYSFGNEANLPGWIYSSLEHPSNLAQVLTETNYPDIYYVQNGKKSHIINVTAYTSLGNPTYNSQSSVKLTNSYVQNVPDGPPIMTDGTYVQASDSPGFFGIWNGSDLEKINANVADDLALTPDYADSQNVLNQLPNSTTPLDKLAKDSSGNLYILDHMQKISITSSQLSNLNLSAGNFVDTDTAFLNRLTSVSLTTPSLIKYSESPSIYLIDNGNLLHIYSFNDFTKLGYSLSNVVPVSNLTLTLFKNNQNDVFAPGRIVKASSNNSLFLTDNGFDYYYIPSMTIFNNYGLSMKNIITLPDNSLSAYTSQGSLVQTVKDQSGNMWVIDMGEKHSLSSTMQGSSYYGINSSNVPTLSSATLNNINTGPAMTQYVQATGAAAVYKIVNGTKEMYTSSSAFMNDGGNWSSIVEVSSSYLTSLPSGPNIY